jgi:hypothetical protein
MHDRKMKKKDHVYNNNLRRQSVRHLGLGGKEGQGLGPKPVGRGTQDSTTLTGWCRTKWSGEGKMIAFLVWKFANLGTEVFLHFPETRKFPFAHAGILHSCNAGRHFRNFPEIYPLKGQGPNSCP